MNNKILTIGVLVLAAIFGGLAPIFSKIALKEFGPITITTTRFCIAFFIWLPIIIASKKAKVEVRDYLKFFITGVFFTGNVVFFILGLRLTTSIISQIFYLICPVIVVILSIIFLKQRFKIHHFLGIILGLIAGLLIISKNINLHTFSNSFGSLNGNLLILLAVTSWSSYLVISKILNKKYSPMTITAYSSLIAVILTIPLLIFEMNMKLTLNPITPTGIVALTGLVIFNSIAVFFLYQWSVNNTSPFIASFTSYISTFVTAVIAIPYLGEKITITLLISGVLLFISSYFVIIYPRKLNNG